MSKYLKKRKFKKSVGMKTNDINSAIKNFEKTQLNQDEPKIYLSSKNETVNEYNENIYKKNTNIEHIFPLKIDVLYGSEERSDKLEVINKSIKINRRLKRK